MTIEKKFVALARVSSREQEREGFSLDVQEDALRAFAERNGGEIIMLWRIAETASKADERTTFKEMVRYVRRHAADLDGILFYKIDRAARNLPDYVKLEELETKYHVPFISISQPTENTPAGRMMRRTLANMAAFFTEQQSLDVRAGQARRVESGLFMGKAPFGYRNVRVEKRGLVEIDPENGPKVKRIFHLYAHHSHTLDSLLVALRDEGITYTTAVPQFGRSKLYEILRDRSYIGEIDYQGQWRPGKHPPLIDRATWDRVQVLLGEKTRRSHELTYAGELIGCGHCGRPITGERVTKKAKGGEREYVYYRCAGYLAEGHPRVRVREADLDAEVLALFDRLKVADPEVRDWFVAVLRAKTKDEQVASRERADELQRQLSQVRGQQDRLVNLRLADESDADTYAKKNTELRDRVATLELQLQSCSRSRHESADLAIRTFELSQSLKEKWLTADYEAKRRILEIVGLNYTLADVNLVCEMRKPFGLLAEGLPVHSSRGDKTPIELFIAGVRGWEAGLRRRIEDGKPKLE